MSRNAAVAVHGTTHRVAVIPVPRSTTRATTSTAPQRLAGGVRGALARAITAVARRPRLTHDERAQQLLHRAAAQQATGSGQGWPAVRDEWLVRGPLR